MEQYRSVLATTAVMVFGLLATSPLLQRQDSSRAQPRANLITASAAAAGGTDGWSDPPRRATTATANVRRGTEVGEASPRPASFTLLPHETHALLAAAATVAQPEPAQRVQAVRRHRAAKVAARSRPDLTARASVADASAQDQPATASQPQRAAGIDPIGDLLRGLGIGRDS